MPYLVKLQSPVAEMLADEKLARISLEIDELILIPFDPYDFTGHADGMIKFIDSHTVVCNDYNIYSPGFREKFEKPLRSAGLDLIYFPYIPSSKKNEFGDYTASGCYINYLRIGDLFIVPIFGLRGEDNTMRHIEDILSGFPVRFINCSKIAYLGGVLNCVGWNIFSNPKY